MKRSNPLIKIAAAALSVVLLLSSACLTAAAADNTPIGYIVAVPTTVSSDDLQTDDNYLLYKSILEEHTDFVETVYAGVAAMETEIDVSQFRIPYDSDNPKAFSTIMQAIRFSFPEFWYVNNYSAGFSWSGSGYYYSKIKPNYITDDIAEKKAAFFDAAKTRYLPLIDDSMDDFTKALILHDALVINSYYPDLKVSDRGSNYTYMVEDYGVCQYYSECYAYLLAQCGIKSEVVSSDEMNHAWLKVLIDGKWYNVDSTWDDPYPERVGHARHAYFLYSDAVFQTDDSGLDRDKHHDYRSINAAESDKYDNYSNLHSSDAAFCYLHGVFYTMTSGGQLGTYDYSNDSVSVLRNLGYRWSSGGGYWNGNYSSLVSYGGKLYFNSPDKVYEYDPATGEMTEFAQKDSDDEIYGIRIIDNQMYVRYANTPNVSAITAPTYLRDMPAPAYTVTIDESIIHGTVEANTYSAEAGAPVTLTVTPDEGFSIESVKVNEEELVPSGGVYSFEMPGSDVTVTAVFSFTDNVGARVVGHSLSLEGDIGVNFYMELDDAVANSQSAYMQFTIPNGDDPVVTQVPVSKAKTKTDGKKTYYIFKCGVAAKEMTSSIAARIINGSQQGAQYSYSVTDYAEYLLKHPEIEGYAAAADVVKAMLNYGAYSQEYFEKTVTTPANAILPANERTTGNVTAETIGKSAHEENLPAGVEMNGSTLSLKSETTLSLYFTSTTPLTFACSGQTIETTSGKGYQIVRIRDIPAEKLFNDFTVTVSAGKNAGTVTFSPMNYCYNVLNGSTDDGKLQNVVKALCTYSLAAQAYFASLNQN